MCERAEAASRDAAWASVGGATRRGMAGGVAAV